MTGSSTSIIAVGAGGVILRRSCSAARANAGPDRIVEVASTVGLDASLSEGPSGLTYSWVFVAKPSGSAASLSGTSTAYPSFVPDLAGAYTIKLTVSSGATSSFDIVVIDAVGADTCDGWFHTSPISETLYGVTYGQGLFVAVGTSGAILTSPTGLEWRDQESGTSASLQAVAAGGGKLVAVGSSGTIVSSVDGKRGAWRGAGRPRRSTPSRGEVGPGWLSARPGRF